MRILIMCVFLTFTLFSYAQGGFIGVYDLDYPGVGFRNILLVEDTIIITGSVKHETKDQWGLVFIKADTMGNILNHITHFDKQGDDYTFNEYAEVIKTKDGGYALTGSFFSRNSPFLMKLKKDGELEFVQEYSDETVSTMRHISIIELKNGYITTGTKTQIDDYKWDIFILRTDLLGNKLWEVNYGEYDLYDLFLGIYKNNENEILLTGSSAWNGHNVPSLFDAWWKPKAIKIDTLGNILWEWQGEEQSFDGSRSLANQLNKDFDGNWVHGGSWGNILDTLGGESIKNSPEIIKVDTNFNLVWATRFGTPNNSMENYFVDIAQAPDGGWVATGQQVKRREELEEGGIGWFLGGHLAKVNAQGDSLWSRVDTVFNSDPYYGSRSELNAVEVLPSGSVIAVGNINRFEVDPSKSYGWIVKVDKDGCLTSGCNIITDGVNLTPLLEGVDVFPNPTIDEVQVKYKGRFAVSVYNSSGQLLLENVPCYQKRVLSFKDLPQGIYYIKVQKGNKMITKKIIRQ